MKQTLKTFGVGLIFTLFTIACNKNNHPKVVPDNISNAVILTWNEVAFDAMGGASNQHSLLASTMYAICMRLCMMQ
jgi:hypothetical protein